MPPEGSNITWDDIRSNSLITKNAGAPTVSSQIAAGMMADDGQQNTIRRSPGNMNQTVTGGTPGQGAQFVYIAATVANILTDNLSQVQINLLANFLSVVTTCVFAILTVESPSDVLSD